MRWPHVLETPPVPLSFFSFTVPVMLAAGAFSEAAGGGSGAGVSGIKRSETRPILISVGDGIHVQLGRLACVGSICQVAIAL